MKSIFNLTFLALFLFSVNLNAHLSNGSTAPNLTLTGINNETHTLYDYSDNVIIENSGCELDAEILTVPVNCEGANDGFSIVNILAGNAPFLFSWSNGETQSSAVELPPGDYSVTITDGDGCELILMTTVTEPASLTLTVETSDETGAGANDGTATTIVGGGTMPYAYEWSNDSTMAVIDNLAPGSYTVIATDANECAVTETININAFDCQMNAQMLVIPANCFGAEDGFAILEITEGTPPYNFSWSNGETLDNIVVFAGEYTLSVTDGNNCVFVFEATVTEPSAALALTTTATGETAVGANDGTVAVSVTGGTEPYTYAWDNDLGSGTSFDNLPPGIYCVTVSDANECGIFECITVNDFECSLDAQMLVIAATCFGQEDGFAIVEILEGTPPYNFLWSNGETLDNIVATAGEYTVSITDGDNCEFILTANILEPEEISANLSLTNETDDNANDGTASAAATGGVAPYLYAWSNGSTNPSIDNLMPGNYSVTITDANGCTKVEGFTVFSFSCDLLITGTTTDISCAQECDGTVLLTTSGGIPPYTYLWNTESTDEIITDLCLGEYTVTVIDAIGCEGIATFVIFEPAILDLTVATATILSCPESIDGTATVLATGGTEPYSYIWSNGNTEATADGLSEEIYTVTVTDANECSAIIDVEITSNDTDAPEVVAQNITVFLDEGGFITIPATDVDNGSTDDCEIESYSLDNDTFNCDDIGENEVTLTVTDFSGNADSAIVIITVMDTIAPTILCPEDIVALACDSSVIYDLPVVFDNCSLITPVLLEGLASGEVFPTGETTVVYGYVDNLDTETCSFVVTVPALPLIAVETQSVSCNGGTDGEIMVTATGSSIYTYEWNTGATTPMISGLTADTYFLTITDEDGCFTTIDVQLLEPDPVADAIIITEVIHETNGESNGAIDVTISNLIPNPTFEWMLDDDVIATTEDLENISTGLYILLVTDENGCKYLTSFIQVDNVVGVNTPTLNAGFTLSPNPTSGLIYIKIDHDFAATAEIQVWDILGQQLLIQKEVKTGVREVQLNLSAFASGTYFVQLNTEEGTFIRKVVR